MSKPLTITTISARNVLKFVEFTVALGKITKFKGANDQGKTSALRLAQIAMEGSTNPYIIREGSEKGEVVVEFSDGRTLRRTFTSKGQYPKVTNAEGQIEPSPQKFLDRLMGELQFNPIEWLSLPAREQIRILLSAVHVQITEAEISERLGRPAPNGVDYSRHGLQVLSDLRDHFSLERKVEKQLADRKRKAAEEALQLLPSVKPTLTAEEISKAEESMKSARAAMITIDSRRLAASEFDRSKQRLEDQIQREEDDFHRIATEVEQLSARINQLANDQQSIRVRQQQIRDGLRDLAASAPPSDEEVAAGALRLDEADREIARIRHARNLIDRFAEVERLSDDANSASIVANTYDDALRILTTEMPRLLMERSSLPVRSLSIEGDRILVEGKDLQLESTSNQMRIALAIARSLNPTLKVICIDGFESLDHSKREAFVSEAAGDGYTYLISEVDPDGGPLQIERIDEPELVGVNS